MCSSIVLFEWYIFPLGHFFKHSAVYFWFSSIVLLLVSMNVPHQIKVPVLWSIWFLFRNEQSQVTTWPSHPIVVNNLKNKRNTGNYSSKVVFRVVSTNQCKSLQNTGYLRQTISLYVIWKEIPDDSQMCTNFSSRTVPWRWPSQGSDRTPWACPKEGEKEKMSAIHGKLNVLQILLPCLFEELWH